MNARRAVGFAALAATLLFALAPAYRSGVEYPVRVHHLLHALMLIGSAIAGMLLVSGGRAGRATRALWLVGAVVAPIFAMLLMWPSEYSPLESLPAAHVAEHLGLVLCGLVTGYAGEVFASGVGVAMSLSLWLMAFLAAWGFGVSPPLQVANLAQPATAPQPALAHAEVAAGHAIFVQNCAACHGAHSQGGMGPPLTGERSRKDLQQAIQWIENPAPPMPKLYPSPLNERSVHEVAEYVESLK